MAFPQFGSLPSELQLQVWEACKSSPAMHIFDVCSPRTPKHDLSPATSSQSDHTPTKSAESKMSSDAGVTVFLDALCTDPQGLEDDSRMTRYQYDPSMYHFEDSLRQTTTASSETMAKRNRTSRKTPVHLPRRRQSLELPDSDVIMLRFRERKDVGVAAARTVFRENDEASSLLGQVLEGQWSPQMVKTFRDATKIAFDLTEPWVAELGSELAYEEITFLACTIQHDLEVLYLVENCVGRCEACGNGTVRAKDLQKKGTLWECLNYQDKTAAQRSGDVIEAVSKKYVEINDFERLGWDDSHPSFIFARMIDELIRSQQHGASKGLFRGVRILVVEDEVVEGRETDMHVRCQGRRSKHSAIDLAMGLFPSFSSVWND